MISSRLAAFAQPDHGPIVYGQHTRLGMNGKIKTVTTYKYTRLKHNKNEETGTKGVLYSVIKNWYDTAGRIIQDSTAIFYNKQSAYGYCKEYNYTGKDSTPAILITTRFDCFPPYDNKAVEETIVELTIPNDSTVLAREYRRKKIKEGDKELVSSYRFTIHDGLIRKTVFLAYKNDREHSGTSMYKYDSFNNFIETSLKIGENSQNVIHHKISNIDAEGNALRMLNYMNNNPEPEFMTEYEFEYYR